VNVSDWIMRKSTSIVTVSTTILFLVFTATILPDQSKQARTLSGDTSPDISFFITTEELYEIAESYGEDGRAAYIRARFTFDLIWPIVYTSFLASGISWSFIRSSLSNTKFQKANLIPVVGMLLDYLENISASIVMLRYPSRTPFFHIAAVIATPLKWVFVGGSFLILVIGFLKYGLRAE
jgi:hypothetical protein